TAPVAAAVPAVAAHARSAAAPLLAVTATGRDAEGLVEALPAYLPRDVVALLPAWETLPHERLSPRSDTVARRIATLRRLTHPEPVREAAGLPALAVAVAPVRAVLQPVAPGLADLAPVRLVPGQRADLTAVVERLAAAAYTRVDMVERRGEFAVRGGL